MVMADDLRADGELLTATRHEPEAFAAFYLRYREAILGYFINRTRRVDLAGDLTAETFAAALAGARAYRGRGSAAGWLFEIARHKLIDSVRRGRVDDRARQRMGMRPIELEDGDLEAVESRIDLEAHEQWLGKLLQELPSAQREAILAHVLDERSYADLAAELECSPAVVRQRVSRGLGTLRARLSEER